MDITVTSIEYKIENGVTTSIEVGFQGREMEVGNLNTRVILKDNDLDDMTRKEIVQAGKSEMTRWFTDTEEVVPDNASFSKSEVE
ncbi:hypothetical protein [Marinilactibacillus kalidii]|uniref:hypothetical protein n=1 Tax=Marinilactibacillus kalidii TaxID=2820274 RepID=UPI001ABEA1BD|nr:hypothetical protein [Marinilactibacillus kalidii]